MKMLLRSLWVAAALVAAMMAGWSFPTIYGDTGLVLVPTADVTPENFVTLGLNYTRLSEDAGDPVVYPLRLTYGASGNTEMFLTVAESPADTAEGGFDAFGGGFKVALLKENLQKNVPGVAFGARILKLSGAVDATNIEGYGAVTKTLLRRADMTDENGWALRAHLTGFFTRYDGDLPADDFLSFGAGVSYNNFDGTSVVVDYISEQKSGGVTYRDSEISAAVRRPLSPEFLLELGTTQPYGVGNGGDLYAGLLYQWGITEAPRHRAPRVDGGY